MWPTISTCLQWYGAALVLLPPRPAPLVPRSSAPSRAHVLYGQLCQLGAVTKVMQLGAVHGLPGGHAVGYGDHSPYKFLKIAPLLNDT